MSSIKDRIAAFNKSPSVEVKPTQSVTTPVRRSSLTTSGTSSSSSSSTTTTTSTTSTTSPLNTNTSSTTLSNSDDQIKGETGGEKKLSVKERASMIKTTQPEPAPPVRRSSIKDIYPPAKTENTSTTSTTPSTPPTESSSSGLSVKERLAQMKASPVTPESTAPVRRSSIKNIYPPQKSPENTPSASETTSTTPPPVSSFRLPSSTPANVTSSTPAVPIPAPSPAVTPSDSSTTTTTITTTSQSETSTTTSNDSASSSEVKPVLSVKDRLAQMKSNPPPIQTPLSRRTTTNDIPIKPSFPSSTSSSSTSTSSNGNSADSAPTSSSSSSSSASISTSSSVSASTPVTRRVTSVNTSFLNKPAEKETPPPGPQTRPKRESKLNPALLGNINVAALAPGGPRPLFAMPPSALTRERSATTSSVSGELVHTTLTRPRLNSGGGNRRSMPHTRGGFSLALNDAGDSFTLVEKIDPSLKKSSSEDSSIGDLGLKSHRSQSLASIEEKEKTLDIHISSSVTSSPDTTDITHSKDENENEDKNEKVEESKEIKEETKEEEIKEDEGNSKIDTTENENQNTTKDIPIISNESTLETSEESETLP